MCGSIRSLVPRPVLSISLSGHQQDISIEAHFKCVDTSSRVKRQEEKSIHAICLYKKWIGKLICSWCLTVNRMHTEGVQCLVSANPSHPSCLTCLSSPPKPDLQVTHNHSSLQGSSFQITLQSSIF